MTDLSQAIVNGFSIAAKMRDQRMQEQSMWLDDQYRRDSLAEGKRRFDLDLGFKKTVHTDAMGRDDRDYNERVRVANLNDANDKERLRLTGKQINNESERIGLVREAQDFERMDAHYGAVAGLMSDAIARGTPFDLNAALGAFMRDDETRARAGEAVAGDPKYFNAKSDGKTPLLPLMTPDGTAFVGSKDGKPIAMTDSREPNMNGKVTKAPNDLVTTFFASELMKSPQAIAQLRRALVVRGVLDEERAKQAKPQEIIAAAGSAVSAASVQPTGAAPAQPGAPAPGLATPPETYGGIAGDTYNRMGLIGTAQREILGDLANPQNLPGDNPVQKGAAWARSLAALPVSIADSAGALVHGAFRGGEKLTGDVVYPLAGGAPTPPAQPTLASPPAAGVAQPASGAAAPASAAPPSLGAPPLSPRSQMFLDAYNMQNLGVKVDTDSLGAMLLTGQPSAEMAKYGAAATAAERAALAKAEAQSTANLAAAVNFVTNDGGFLKDQRAAIGQDMQLVHQITGAGTNPDMARSTASMLARFRQMGVANEPEDQPLRVGMAIGAVNAGIDPSDTTQLESAYERTNNFLNTNGLSASHTPLLTELYAMKGLSPESAAKIEQAIASLDGPAAQNYVNAGGLKAMLSVGQ